jgi:hypothetical protein
MLVPFVVPFVIDAARNAVWLAYGASPGELPARIARLEPH